MRNFIKHFIKKLKNNLAFYSSTTVSFIKLLFNLVKSFERVDFDGDLITMKYTTEEPRNTKVGLNEPKAKTREVLKTENVIN